MLSNRMIFIGLSIFLLSCRYVQCIYDIPGETSPFSKEMKVGDSVNISCRMNPKFFRNRSVKDLYFINGITHERVPDADIVPINDTTIVYMLRNAQESKTLYRCMCGINAIMDTKIYVGREPQPVTNFTCQSFNYEYMKCNFTKPKNHVLTHYNVSYHFDFEAYKYSPICDHDQSPLVTCITRGMHVANQNMFYYEITATNSLGNLTKRYPIDSQRVMVLAPPGQNFDVRRITSNSATFTFRLKIPSKDLQWKLFLKPKNLSSITLSPKVLPVPISNNNFELRLANLSYAYYEYEIQLSVRLSDVNSWSAPFTYSFRTTSRIPDRPPRTDVGSFEIDSSEKQIRIYWELLKPYEHNGQNFTYVIEQNGLTQAILPSESNSFVFLWKKEMRYNFFIRSQNQEGLSKLGSRITIPAMENDSKRNMHTPPAVHNIYHEKNSTFTLSWIAPKAVEELVDFTVYWCRKKILLSSGCEGSIHFQRVPRDVYKFTTQPQEHTLHLAVSANYIDFNTGMHWTECTMREESDLVKMEPEVKATSPTTIKVEWGSENVCPSIFDRYNLSYCKVNVNGNNKSDIDTYNCTNIEAEKYILIEKTSKRWELKNLKPYTHYKIEMFMYSQRKFGKKSNPKVVQTWEAAPTPPRQLNVSHISNTSATITWMPPSERNGLIRSYTIVVNNERIELQASKNFSHDRIEYKLPNLSSSTSYKVFVLANTVASSQPSNDIVFTTLVGYPSLPGPVSLHDSKGTAVIEWVSPPGRTDFYEVAVTLMKRDKIINQRISIVVGANSCVFRRPQCFDGEYRTTVDVRSVNAALITHESDYQSESISNPKDDVETYFDDSDELSCNVKPDVNQEKSVSLIQKQQEMLKLYSDVSEYQLYKSPWTRGPIFDCAASTLGKVIMYVASVILAVVGFALIVYFARKKYNKMANIDCTLPAGLDAFNGVSAVLSQNFRNAMKGDISNHNGGIVEEGIDVVQNRNVRDYVVQNEERRLLGASSNNSLFISDQAPHLDFVHQLQEHSQNTSSAFLGNKLITANQCDSCSESEFDNNECFKVRPTNNIENSTEVCSNNVAEDSRYVKTSEILNQSRKGGTVMIPDNSCYIKPNGLNSWQNINENQSKEMNPKTGYISVESITNTLPKTVQNDIDGGYTNSNPMKSISQLTIGTPARSSQDRISNSNITTNNPSGYTTLEQLNKLSTLTSSVNTSDTQNEVLNSEVRPIISGYVTQRDLTAFGQHQQQPFF